MYSDHVQCLIFRVICAEELMSVMVSLGNPRTMKEIKVQTLNTRQ